MRKLGTALGCALILVWCLLPVAWIISLSFKSQVAITNGSPGFLPADGDGAGWQNYQDVLDNEQFQLGIGSALSVLLFLSVLAIAFLIVKIFRVNLADARQEG